jgi:hypothetical protein
MFSDEFTRKAPGTAGPFVRAAMREIALGLDGGHTLDRLAVRAGVQEMGRNSTFRTTRRDAGTIANRAQLAANL